MNKIQSINSSLTGLIKLLITKIHKDFHVCIPAIVTDVKKRLHVDVNPLINVIDMHDKSHKRAVITDVPIYHYGTNDFSIMMPVKKDDIGLLISCDRDISLFTASIDEEKDSSIDFQDPSSSRTHDFADSFFIPISIKPMQTHDDKAEYIDTDGDGCLKDKGVDGVSKDSLLIQSKDQKTEIIIGKDGIRMISNTICINGVKFDRDGTMTVAEHTDDVVVMHGKGKINVGKEVEITKDTITVGDKSTGVITTTKQITIGDQSTGFKVDEKELTLGASGTGLKADKSQITIGVAGTGFKVDQTHLTFASSMNVNAGGISIGGAGDNSGGMNITASGMKIGAVSINGSDVKAGSVSLISHTHTYEPPVPQYSTHVPTPTSTPT